MCYRCLCPARMAPSRSPCSSWPVKMSHWMAKTPPSCTRMEVRLLTLYHICVLSRWHLTWQICQLCRRINMHCSGMQAMVSSQSQPSVSAALPLSSHMGASTQLLASGAPLWSTVFHGESCALTGCEGTSLDVAGVVESMAMDGGRTGTC